MFDVCVSELVIRSCIAQIEWVSIADCRRHYVNRGSTT